MTKMKTTTARRNLTFSKRAEKCKHCENVHTTFSRTRSLKHPVVSWLPNGNTWLLNMEKVTDQTPPGQLQMATKQSCLRVAVMCCLVFVRLKVQQLHFELFVVKTGWNGSTLYTENYRSPAERQEKHG